MAFGIGPKVKVQFKREAAWANGGYTSDHCISVEDVAFETKPDIAESANMPAANATSQPWMVDNDNAGLVITTEKTDGQLTTPLDYEGLLQFIDMMYGTATFGTYGGDVSGSYVHAFTEKEFLNSMQMEVFEGGVVAGKCSLVVGVKARQMTITGKAVAGEGNILKLVMDLVAQKKTPNSTPSATLNTTVARVPVCMVDMTTGLDGTGDSPIVIRSFELTMKPTIVDKTHQGGSKYIREPIRVGLIDTRLKITREYSSDTPVTKLIAGTTGAPQLTFTKGAKIFDISMPYAKLMSASQPKPTLSDVMTQDLEWKAQWKNNYGCAITVTNTTTAALA